MMKTGQISAFAVVVALGIAVGLRGADPARAQNKMSSGGLSTTEGIRGQTVTQLSGGALLRIGGEAEVGPIASASIGDPATGKTVQLKAVLTRARAWHTATVCPDGSVLIIGGRGADRKAVSAVEKFDPSSETFTTIKITGLTSRFGHTATLLSDGSILVVGGSLKDGQPTASAQLVDTRTDSVSDLPELEAPRSGHIATLLPDGAVRIEGGAGADGAPITSVEVFDPKQQRFTTIDPSAHQDPSSASGSPKVVGSIPDNGASNVPLNTVISVRFSGPMKVESIDSQTVTLSGPEGRETAKIVAAENGRLAFIDPDSPLQPRAGYTIEVDGIVDLDDVPVAPATFHFTTAAARAVGSPGSGSTSGSSGEGGDQVWIPTDDWRTNLPPSPWQSLPPLRAPNGVTALSGQVLKIDGEPLANVTLQIGKRTVRSTGDGRFLLAGLDAGWQVLKIDGSTANHAGVTYGFFQVGISVRPNQTTVLAFTIWMPVLDTAHAVTLPSPTTSATVLTNPLMPGLELHIPAGTIIRDANGNVVQTVSITPVPLDRPPFPLPIGVQVPIYFTIQPGGSQLWTTSGKWAWAQLYYPNPDHLGPGTLFDFWNYDAGDSGWYVYGHGKVSSDGSQAIPDPGVGIWSFTGAMVGGPGLAPPGPNPAPPGSVPTPAPNPDPQPKHPPTGCPGANGGDPVDCSTGLFFDTHTDLTMRDVIPIGFARSYRTGDQRSRPFGIGATDNYEMFLVGDAFPYTYQYLILPDGSRVYYVNLTYQKNGDGNYQDTLYEATTAPGAFFGSTIVFNGHGWNLKLRDGTVLTFPDSYNTSNPALAALVGITDRNGNSVTINRDSNGNITQVISPNLRWITVTHDSSNRITQLIDNTGRTVSYAYDSGGRLSTVTDANGGLTSYTYDSGNRMLTMTDPRGNTVFTNQYDTAGRVALQTLPDGSTYQFSYALDSNGNVTQTTITDPRGIVEQKNFQIFTDSGNGQTGTSNSNGFMVSDVMAVGKPEQQTITWQRDSNTNLTKSATDALGRQTSWTYDALGNVLSVTRLAGTSQAATTRYTYDSTFNQLTSLTDPLGHVWNLTLDNHGNTSGITDPLGHQTGVGYNLEGETVSTTDAAGDTSAFAYSNGDLSSMTDALGNVTSIFVDAAGRLAATTDPTGLTTVFTYDSLNRLTQITDAKSGLTKFTYDADGDLLSVTDGNNNTTSYTYDTRNRLTSRTDPLLKTESYVYDGNWNLTQYTDRRGTVDVFSYDGLNRRTSAGFGPTGATSQDTITYTWDGGNRLTQAVDSIAGTISRTYDGLDDLLSETTPQGSISYSYDLAPRRTSMTVSGQTAVSYTWDNANNLQAITQSSTSVGFVYDAANRRTQLTLPNGIQLTYTYDNDSHVTGMTWALGQTQIGNLTYRYDANGRVVERAGSLAQTLTPNAVSGNQFNADNAMTAFNGKPMAYDANGNLLTDGSNVYSWDSRNHLSAIAGQTSAQFVYDALGRRQQKRIVTGLSTTTTAFLYDGENPIQEQTANTLGTFSPSANLLAGLGIDEYFTRSDSSGTMSLLADSLGSTIALTDSNGSTQTQYAYEPFGNTTVSGPANANPYQFTGRENDGTGMYFYRARYYSPIYQRFVGQDSIGFRGGQPNLYGYTSDAPINLRDPFGHWSIGVSGYDLIGGGVTVGVNPDSTPFVTVDVGVGIGGGLSIDPNGTSPGYVPAQSADGVGLGYGAGQSVNASLGPLGAGLEHGTNVTPSGQCHDYSNPKGGFDFAPGAFKFEAGANYNPLEFNVRLY